MALPRAIATLSRASAKVSGRAASCSSAVSAVRDDRLFELAQRRGDRDIGLERGKTGVQRVVLALDRDLLGES